MNVDIVLVGKVLLRTYDLLLVTEFLTIATAILARSVALEGRSSFWSGFPNDRCQVHTACGVETRYNQHSRMQLAEAWMMNAVIANLGTTLGLSSIFIGFSPAVLAQPRLEPVSQNSETTLSGDSLRTVEDRTVDSDYQNLIGERETAANAAKREGGLGDTFRLKIDRALEFITTPSDAQRQGNPLPLKPNDSGTGAGVQLQLGL